MDNNERVKSEEESGCETSPNRLFVSQAPEKLMGI